MAIPAFSSDEKHLISSVRSEGLSKHVVWDLTYLVASAIFVVLGYLAEEPIVGFITGATIILCFKQWEWKSYRRFHPVWISIVDKCEQAASDHEISSSVPAPEPRLQFSLRVIFVVTLLVCVFCAGWTAGTFFRSLHR